MLVRIEMQYFTVLLKGDRNINVSCSAIYVFL